MHNTHRGLATMQKIHDAFKVSTSKCCKSSLTSERLEACMHYTKVVDCIVAMLFARQSRFSDSCNIF